MMEILKPTYTDSLMERFAGLAGFQVLDEATVQFELEEPNAAFLASAIADLKFLPNPLIAGLEFNNVRLSALH
jgi:ABC-type transport system substrate-binding protein